MPQYTVKLLKQETVAESTIAFYFDKPVGFTFGAGQYLDMTLPDPPETDAEGNIRSFSIASAPTEPHLMVATRMRDTAFKRVLAKMPPGSVVQIEGPSGDLVLPNDPSRPVALLAGGIGITPFRSMVVRAARERLPHRITLFFSNRRPEDAAFLAELMALRGMNPNFTLVETMTEAAVQSWAGETRCISPELLADHLASLHGPIYYVTGPPEMVGAMQKMLHSVGVDDLDIRPEEFSGY